MECGLALGANDQEGKLYVYGGFSKNMNRDKIKFVFLKQKN